jgi:hypothetical protein
MKIAINKQLATMFGIGILVVLFGIGVVLFVSRGAHIELKGSILKVRTQALDEANSVAVVDFRFANPSDYPFVVRSVTVSLKDAAGKAYEGAEVSDVDAKRLFQYYPLLGQKFNDSLLMRDKIKPRHTEDRMIAVRFEVPVQQLDARKQLSVRIEDVDGPVSELLEK